MVGLRYLLVVFLGGGFGAAARYAVILGVDRVARTAAGGFPFGTLTVNLVGSALIGVVGGLLVTGAPSEDDTTVLWRLALIVGVLGGFTTMSSFAADAIKLFETGRIGAAIVYGVVTNVGCVAAAVTGGLVASRLAS